MELSELKGWLRIDGTDEDITLNAMMNASEKVIEQSTGVLPADVSTDAKAQALYNLVQKIIITDLYENRDGSGKLNPVLISMYAQLEAYKLGDTV